MQIYDKGAGMSEKDTSGKKKGKAPDGSNPYKNLSLITQFTLYMLVPIGGLSAGGYFLDRYFHTSWIFIVCFFVGAVAGGQNVYRLAMKIAKQKSPEPERNIINRRKESSESTNDTILENEKQDSPGAVERDDPPGDRM